MLSSSQLMVCSALLAAAATWGLARLAPRLGWVDAGDGGRKQQRVPLATVGGAAIGLALALVWIAQPAFGPSSFASPGWKAAALLTAFAVGLLDDLLAGGLRPRAKLAGQALAGVVLAAPQFARAAQDPAALGVALALVAAALVALNALNTYDNADGAAGGLALLGLAPAAPLAAAAILGFLPFNLLRRRVPGGPGTEPRAILGDSGSHLLGMAVLITPGAWPVLALPLFDLARVSIERLRAGQPPWLGDRRHLAHRLERSGLSSLASALVLALLALPSACLGLSGPVGARVLGMAVTLLGALIAVYLTRVPRAQRVSGLTGPQRG